ncbi:phage minor head protein [Anaerohalosphaeraceae bacterium U12dextr]
MKGSDIIKADDLIARIMFDISEENKKLIVLHKVFFGKASDLGIAQSLSEVAGIGGKPLADAVRRLRLSPTVRNAIAVSSHKITLVNKTTQNRIARQLVAGLEAGEGLPQLKRRIDQVIDTSSAATGRAGLIARTQTAGGVSAGRQAGLSDAGVQLKGWLSAQDSAVRPTHKNADYKYADGIPINHPFDIGGVKLMYPGDPNSTDVGEIANCRCALVPVAAHGKTWTLTDYDQVKVLTYAEIEPLLNEVSHA